MGKLFSILIVCCILQSALCERSGRQERDLPEQENDLTQDEIDTILGEHNRYRSNAEASDMKIMTWDNSIAETSKNYAELCKWEHSDTSNGENLYVSSSTNRTQIMDSFTTSWHNEIDFYTYADRSCVEGKMCGHYTQVVWANSYKLGCGSAVCTSIPGLGSGPWTLVVCQYFPVGNWRGQFPFTEGDACAGCAGDDYCYNSMCANTARDGMDFRDETTATESATTPAASPTSSQTTNVASNHTTTVGNVSPTKSVTATSQTAAHMQSSTKGGASTTSTSEGPIIELTTAPHHGTSTTSSISPSGTATETTTPSASTGQGFTTRPTQSPNERCTISEREYLEYVAIWKDETQKWKTKFEEWKADFDSNTQEQQGCDG